MSVVDAIGVVVTGAAGVGGAYWGGRIALRATREATEAEERRHREDRLIATRAAARMVRNDLVRALASITHTLADGVWHPERVSLDSWEANAAVLARLLDEDEWRTVTGAVIVARYQAREVEERTSQDGSMPVDDAWRSILGDWQRQIEAALDVFNRYITIGELLGR